MGNKLHPELEDKRMQYAIRCITKIGYEITYADKTQIKFIFDGSPVAFFPYTGWATGKTIEDGRGIQKLLDQITPMKEGDRVETKYGKGTLIRRESTTSGSVVQDRWCVRVDLEFGHFLERLQNDQGYLAFHKSELKPIKNV